MTARHTVRFRLTLLYVGLFLASAAGLLTITYFLVAQQLPRVHTVSAGTGGGDAGGLNAAAGGLGTGGLGTGGLSAGGNGFFIEQNAGPNQACPQLTVAIPPTPQAVNGCIIELSQQAADVRGNALDQLLIESGIALGIMAVVSIGLGWLMAGRVLRPLRTMTATARRISARSLHQRIAISGPNDELKELGDTFDALLERLDASFRAQRQFVANASHELRTPLARQRTVLEVALRDRQASADTLAIACERALAASEQQERLIAAMLTLARGERGLDRFAPVDLAAITEETVLAREAEATSNGLTTTTQIAPGQAIGDPSLAERLVANLIDNAIRHNEPGGRITIRTGTADDGRPFLTVSNTGPLIAAGQVPRLFQPFERMDQARTASTGLGLGLPIVAAIAAAHEAALTAQPNPGGGLTVTVTFRGQPLPPPASGPARAAAAEAGAAEAGPTDPGRQPQSATRAR